MLEANSEILFHALQHVLSLQMSIKPGMSQDDTQKR